jgi:hypothetical protein
MQHTGGVTSYTHNTRTLHGDPLNAGTHSHFASQTVLLHSHAGAYGRPATQSCPSTLTRRNTGQPRHSGVGSYIHGHHALSRWCYYPFRVPPSLPHGTLHLSGFPIRLVPPSFIDGLFHYLNSKVPFSRRHSASPDDLQAQSTSQGWPHLFENTLSQGWPSLLWMTPSQGWPPQDHSLSEVTFSGSPQSHGWPLLLRTPPSQGWPPLPRPFLLSRGLLYS